MKYILYTVVITFYIGIFSAAALSLTPQGINELNAADFLAKKSVIKDVRPDIDITGTEYELIGGGETMAVLDAYGINNTITRREMLKVMMNMSGDPVQDTCEGKFTDMNSSDWGCKYAEAALEKGYIAGNVTFRPDDNVSKIEAMKFIMQAKGIERDPSEDWREGYVSKAVTEGILNQSFFDYNTASLRGWIFVSGSKTYTDAPDFIEEGIIPSGLTPEDEELLNHFLNI